MNRRHLKTAISLSFMAVCSVAVFSGCTDLNYPYGPPNSGGYNSNGGGYNSHHGGSYNDPYYGNDRHNSNYDREREEQRELERERRRLDEERRELERERKREQNRPPPVSAPPPREELRCPPGTHESTHRCTSEERKRGCKDYGGPNGRGCSNF